jgi:hypothetical protein
LHAVDPPLISNHFQELCFISSFSQLSDDLTSV